MLIALQIVHLPENLSYKAFAFGEPGANLSAAYLVRQGMRPNVDFGHTYGLLELLFADLWFRVTGLTPLAYWAGVLLLEVAMCAVLAEFAVTAQLTGLSVLLLFVSFPVFIWVNYFNFAHVIETLCLMGAVTAHLKGRYGLALAAAAAAVLARPALGYVYGFVLLCIVLAKVFRTHSLKLSVLALPACTTALLAALLAWRFGMTSLSRTLLPITGAASYRAIGYGFFNRGMEFWLPSPFKLQYYLGIPGFWLIANISVLLLGPLALLRSRDEKPGSLGKRKSELLAASAAIVFCWIFFAFSHQYTGSWILYLWLSVCSVALLPEFFPGYAVVTVLLAVVALNSDRHQVLGSLPQWPTAIISSLFPHTFTQGNEDEQIKELLSTVKGHRTVVLMHAGAMPLLHDGLGQPLSEFFMPAVNLPGDELRAKSASAAAEMVFIPTPPWYGNDTGYFSWDDFLDKKSRYRVILRNPSGFVLGQIVCPGAIRS